MSALAAGTIETRRVNGGAPIRARHRSDTLARRTPADIVQMTVGRPFAPAGRGTGRQTFAARSRVWKSACRAAPMSLLALVPVALCLFLCLIPAWLLRRAKYAR